MIFCLNRILLYFYILNSFFAVLAEQALRMLIYIYFEILVSQFVIPSDYE